MAVLSLSRFVRAAVVIAVLAVAAGGCSRDGGDSPGAGSVPAASAVRCVAPESLPGSLPLEENVRAAIAASEVPRGESSRTTCNRLALEPGAFARRRSTDAIDWRPWSRAALAEALALDRPLLVLTGSSACPECDDLARATFGRRRFVRDVNRYFIPVLVDREQRPDVDAYLMFATQVLTGGGGWPAVVFVLGDGRPFEARSWGAAATGDRRLVDMVEDVRRRIELGGGTIQERGELTMEKMQRRADLDTKGALPDAAATAEALLGFGSALFSAATGGPAPLPTFPRPPFIEFLLGLARNGDAVALGKATSMLAEMDDSPLHDERSGGFFRFAKEPGWQNPERTMLLAENSAIASAYFEAAAVSKQARFAEAGAQVVDFLLRDLARDDGFFAASIDASGDSPRRDERVLADANALAISALVRAAEATQQSRYLDAAVAAGKLLDARLRDGNFVNHCLETDSRRCADGYLADHVFTALAFVDLDQAHAPGGDRWLDAARMIADALPQRFGHDGTGGFFQTAAGADSVPIRLKPALDTVLPSANSAAVRLYTRLAARTGDEVYAKEATRTLEAFAEALALRPLTLPSMVAALQAVSAPPQLEPAPAVQP